MTLLSPWLRTGLLSASLLALPSVSFADPLLLLGSAGHTDFVIYLTPDAPDSVKTAATDLQTYFRKTGNFTPEIKTQVAAPDGPYISLGNTPAAKAAGIDAAQAKYDGFRVATRGNHVFILGNDTPAGEVTALGGVSNGTANGVYWFCERVLGVHWVLPGEIGEEYTPRDAIEMPEMDLVESPAMSWRVLPYSGDAPNTVAWRRHMRLGAVAAVKSDHNFQNLMPPSYFDAHPEWFAEIGGKRLPPAGRYKIETTNPEMVREAANRIEAAFAADPNRKWYSISPTDGGGWSESEAAKAYQEMDPLGRVSYTPLVLKFYNDLAKIVGQKYPDRKLGGYIYARYLFPPKAGIPRLEPNLSLTVAGSVSYGYTLYRPETRAMWDGVVRTWGEAAQKSGADLYYYDLPTFIKQSLGLILPPAPEILNTVFSRLDKYGYDGAYIYGVDGWPQAGPTNYVISRLLWNPRQDAVELCREYYRETYGSEAAPEIEAMYDTLDKAYKTYYLAHPDAATNLTSDSLAGIYGASYPEVETHFLKAQAAARGEKHAARLRLLGQTLSLTQRHLKGNGALVATYHSALTLNDDQIDALFSPTASDFPLKSLGGGMKPELEKWKVAPVVAGITAAPVPPIATLSDVRLLLFAPSAGEISVVTPSLDAGGELVPYTVYDAANGKVMRYGAMMAGRQLHFPAAAGQSFVLEIPSVGGYMDLHVTGATAAFKADAQARGFRINVGGLVNADTPLGFHVPEGTENFNLTVNGLGVIADVLAPDGKKIGTIDTSKDGAARLKVHAEEAQPGDWKLVLHKAKAGESVIFLVLDPKLPQWVFPDPSRTLRISKGR